MIGINVKETIEKKVNKVVKDFMEREDIVTEFGEPIIGYVSTTHMMFDMFFTRGLSDHPKHIYRPGNTIILHFVPYSKDVSESNIGGSEPSEKWSRAFIESIWLSMKINSMIAETLDSAGRLSSLLNTPTDWNEEVFHEEWSHKMAAYAAGMGVFGTAGSFHTEAGFGGRVSGIITDGKYADECEVLDDEQLKDIYQSILTQCRYEGAENVSCSPEMIASCPAGAISERGVDRAKCQEHCKSIDKDIPCPDVCGKCFSFK